MLVLKCHIQIGELVFNYAKDVTIVTSWRNLTDTCRIELPRNLFLRSSTGRSELFDLIKPGDAVRVALGYMPNLKEEFVGFVARVSPTLPLVIECEDLMWQFKREDAEFSLREGKLQNILKELYSGPVLAFDASLGSFRVSSTKAKVLEKIKESYGLYSFFRGETLVCGKVYEKPDAKEYRWDYRINIISNDLEFRSKSETKLKVKAISILPDNTKIEVELGDSDGEERTLHYYNITSANELKGLAELELDRLSYDGYRGSFTSFGFPSTSHGDKAVITGDKYGDATGVYYVDSVTKKWGVGGYRQTIELGPKAAVR